MTGWHLVRVTLEALSPLSCGSGEAGPETDVHLVRDPSGLPTIPGSTLQGLLRAFHPAGPDRDALFGCEDRDGTGTAGRLVFSHARVHDSCDVAAGFPADLADPLLADLAKVAPVRRDHVKLTHRHAAEEGAQFDRAAVPVGTRFSFEVLMRGEETEKEALLEVLSALAHPLFRIGGKGRRGYGRVEVRKLHHGFFPAAMADAFRETRARPLSDMQGLQHEALQPAEVTVITLRLMPEGPWRTGGDGAPVVSQVRVRGAGQGGGDLNIPRQQVGTAPTREAVVVERNGTRELRAPSASVARDYVLPGSSVAGPLRHRTIFHWNRLMGQFVDPASPPDATTLQGWREGRGGTEALFGWSRPVARAEKPDGRASALVFDDVRFQPTGVLALDHVVIDAFHGGARGRLLFDEELVAPESLKVTIAVDRRWGTGDPDARQALGLAIRDLLTGRLALGAKSYGFMDGRWTVEGPDSEPWRAALTAAGAPEREPAA